MIRGRMLFFCFLVTLAAVVSAGCADQYAGRMAVNGKVTLEGEVLKNGIIMFQSAEIRTGAPISNGKYEIPQAQGLKPGSYVVQITAGDGKTPAARPRPDGKAGGEEDDAAAPGGSTNIVSVDIIPPEWNTQSTQRIEVVKGGPNTFPFDIPKKNTPKRRR